MSLSVMYHHHHHHHHHVAVALSLLLNEHNNLAPQNVAIAS
jgi:hypothetical protein